MTMLQRFRLASLATLLCLYGCNDESCVEGQGPRVPQVLELESFEGVNFAFNGAGLATPGEVTIVQGDEQRVEVFGQENIIERLNTQVEEGVWRIDFRGCVNNADTIYWAITLPEQRPLRFVELSGLGNILAETTAGSLTSVLSGEGTVVLSGESTEHEVTLSGSGGMSAFELATEDTAVTLSGTGVVRVAASEQLNVNITGSGDVIYRGNPTVNTQGSGGSVLPAP